MLPFDDDQRPGRPDQFRPLGTALAVAPRDEDPYRSPIVYRELITTYRFDVADGAVILDAGFVPAPASVLRIVELTLIGHVRAPEQIDVTVEQYRDGRPEATLLSPAYLARLRSSGVLGAQALPISADEHEIVVGSFFSLTPLVRASLRIRSALIAERLTPEGCLRLTRLTEGSEGIFAPDDRFEQVVGRRLIEIPNEEHELLRPLFAPAEPVRLLAGPEQAMAEGGDPARERRADDRVEPRAAR